MLVDIDIIRKRAFSNNCKIVLVDGADDRVLFASEILTKNSNITPVLIGNEEKIQKRIGYLGLSIQPKVYNPINNPLLEEFVQILRDIRKKRGKKELSEQESIQMVSDSAYFASMLLETGRVDGMLGGSSVPTSVVLKAGLDIIGLAEDASIVSGSFVMFLPNTLPAGQQILVFSDCAVVPNPNSDQLSFIAANAIKVTKKVVGMEPVVAFLSFSTKGSASHPLVDRVVIASHNLVSKWPQICADGELQLDAAIIPEISKRKAPGSAVGGHANVLIFPDLNSGNIAYKMVERLAGAKALGVIIEGFRKPVNDLSRGCSTEDIVDMVCVTALQTM